MAYYPAMLNLNGRAVLFIGGGWETAIKVRGLLEVGARVTLYSEHTHPELEGLAGITWHRRAYQPGDMAGFWLVMSHPVDKAFNHAVFDEAEACGILCNCVDDPERCHFILPSVVRRGDLVIGVSTSGTAPALGVRIKQRLAATYGPEYAAFLDVLRELRPGITAGFANFETRKHLWYKLVDSEALTLVSAEQTQAAREVLTGLLKARRAQCQMQPCQGCELERCRALQPPTETLSAEPPTLSLGGS